MLSRREMVMVIVLIIALVGAAYFLMFLQPTLGDIATAERSITRKAQTLSEALELAKQYEALGEAREGMMPDWMAYTEGVPVGLDDAEALRVIQEIIYPYNNIINVDFAESDIEIKPLNEDEEAESEDKEPVSLINRVVIEFTAGYDEINKILESFKNEELVNRVVNFTMSRAGITETGGASYHITMEVDFLTQN